MSGAWVQSDEQMGHRGFQGSKTTLHDTTKIDTCHYTFVKTHIMHTKSEP